MLKAVAYTGSTNDNRFVLLDLRQTTYSIDDAALGVLSRQICENDFADDVLVLCPSKEADVSYRVFGGDGREASFCCNGALFVIAKLRDEGLERTITLETRSGLCIGSGLTNLTLQIRSVDITRFSALPKTYQHLKKLDLTILDGCTAGEPHLLVSAPSFLVGDRFKREVFEEICAPLCEGFEIEGGVNVTMIFQADHHGLMIRTFERGVKRMTASCGSGALASAFYMASTNAVSLPLAVRSPGGVHRIWRDHASDRWCISTEPSRAKRVSLASLMTYANQHDSKGRRTVTAS